MIENPSTLLVICGYDGDEHQIKTFLPLYEHHNIPIVVLSPEDAPIKAMGPHICISRGKRAYTGQDSLNRQHLHLREALRFPFKHYLFHDADSFTITPQIPAYLYERDDVFYSNQVNDFRVPGGTWEDGTVWPIDFHEGYPLIAMQPPYFMSRGILEKLVEAGKDFSIKACEITPFIDFYMVQLCTKQHIKHKPFRDGVSCETVTENGRAIVSRYVREGANMIHSVKSEEAMNLLMEAYKERTK